MLISFAKRLFSTPALQSLSSLLPERGPISRRHSRFIYTSQVRGLICSEPLGPGWAGARGLLPAAPPGRASNVSAARPARGTAAASNIEQQRHLASTCSNAVRPGKSPQIEQAGPSLGPKVGRERKEFPNGCERERGVPGREFSQDRCPCVFQVLQINLLKGFTLFSFCHPPFPH